jgi:hypothetical protein
MSEKPSLIGIIERAIPDCLTLEEKQKVRDAILAAGFSATGREVSALLQWCEDHQHSKEAIKGAEMEAEAYRNCAAKIRETFTIHRRPA